MKKIIKPPELNPGDTIGVISPSGPVDESDLQPGLDLLKSYGFKTRVGSHVFDRKNYLAGDDDARLYDLHNMFLDKDITAIFCARGGYGSLRLLEKIRYDIIKENPKILVGYSDVTALLMAIYKKTGLVTFHGPMVRDFAAKDKDNLDSLLKLLSSRQAYELALNKDAASLPGKAKGRLLGGNLSLICHLTGTDYLPSLDSCILFIEETEEPLYRIDRMLTHLILSNQLKGLVGLIGAEFEGCEDTSAVNMLLLDLASKLNIPLATGLAVGHGLKNLTIPLGLTAELNTVHMTLSTRF